MADIDEQVADSHGRALVLIEIVERRSSPKNIIGDIFALAMSNHVAVGHGDQTCFTIGAHTQVIIAGVLRENGLVARRSIQSSRPTVLPFIGMSMG